MTKPFQKTEQIGSVLVKYIETGRKDAPIYSDGMEEDQLYMKCKADPNYGANLGDAQFPSWVEEYHFSPRRLNLLKWLPFDASATILEIGAGCGALTGLLCQRGRSVTALEYSTQRALITAMRHSQHSNLEVIVGGLQDFAGDQKFDYITVIGVLEYAAKFYGGEKPYEAFLAKLGTMLNPNGALILAIENKLGLKYICGAQEDHTGRVFDSIYDYPYSNSVRTFSRKELTDLLSAAGFSALEWYYPFPDYKMPQEVISERITPGDLDPLWSLFPAKTARRRRKEIFSERRFARTVAQAGLFAELANSFLVVARSKDVAQEHRCLRFTGANMQRKRKFRTNKRICRDGRGKLFILTPDNDESIKFVHEIVEREALARTYFGNEAEVVTGKLKANSLVYPYIPFPTIVELMAEAIGNGDSRFGRSWIDEYLRFLRKLPAKTCVPNEFLREMKIAPREIREPLPCFSCGILDCVPHNILTDQKSKKYYIVDNEFTCDFPIPIDFLIWHAIHTLVLDLQRLIQSHVCEEQPVVVISGHGVNRHYMPLSWLDVLTDLKTPLRQQLQWSSGFQNMVKRRRTKLSSRLRERPRPLTCVPVSEIKVNQGMSERLYEILRKTKRIWGDLKSSL